MARGVGSWGVWSVGASFHTLAGGDVPGCNRWSAWACDFRGHRTTNVDGWEFILMGSPLYFSHPACLEHRTPTGHPERPGRIAAIEQALARCGWLGYELREAPPASQEMLVAVHSPGYVEAVRSMSRRGGGAFDPETVVS